ncbi:hypothetical protein [Kitasatospora sp. DSM 101779]|uniref:hypothetical protein n=1 Tax=Kitasatospora sp. DSM 101779 TaxID=2853165 RepID=UPI0021D9D630|nr:hypothetical protein [Kitasatospora sp. DSM 101779]MCU7821295.1 hypothetical protein [Kitasatospora sp. DSM 101779]
MTVIVSVTGAGCGCAPRRAWSASPVPAWAGAAGTALVRWPDADCTGSPYDGRGVAPTDRMPVAGEQRMLGLDGPLLVEGQFWCLFTPAATAVNGTPDHPDELPQHALVRCTPLAVADARPGGAWVRVAVEEVVPLTEAQKRWAPSSAGSVADLLPPEGAGVDRTSVRCGALRYVEWSAQGDLGRRAVFREGDGRSVLLMYAEWSFDEEDVAFGHRPLSAAETAAVQACWPSEG